MQYAQTDTGQRQLTEINALLEEAVQLAHSRRSLDRSFNVTIYTEYESAIALSELAFSERARAFINILDSACYAIFQKQKSWQQGIEPPTESLTLKIRVKTHNLVKAVENRCDKSKYIYKLPKTSSILHLLLNRLENQQV